MEIREERFLVGQEARESLWRGCGRVVADYIKVSTTANRVAKEKIVGPVQKKVVFPTGAVHTKIVVKPAWVSLVTEHGLRASEANNGYQRSTENMTKTLYFGNLPWAVTNDDLTNAVSQHAEVISARVATDRETGRSRGFGFVEVAEDSAQAVIDALNGADWGGRPLTVNEAKPREERPRNGGGRRF